MRHARDFRRSRRGSAMLIATISVGLILTVVAALLTVTIAECEDQRAAAIRTRILFIADAGASDAFLDLRQEGSGDRGTPDAPLPFGGGTYWADATPNGDRSFTVVSNATLAGQARAVEVSFAPEPDRRFAFGLFGVTSMTMNAVTMDSYDSGAGSYASQATNYLPGSDVPYANPNGDGGSNGTITANGGGLCFGDLSPGPGYTVKTSGSFVITGSTTPAEEPVSMPPVDYAPPIPSAGAFVASNPVVLSEGVYRYDSFSLSGQAKVTFTGAVTLYVDGSVSIAGQTQLVLAPGATVVLYHGGSFGGKNADLSLEGGGLVNQDQNPAAFQIYSAGTGKVSIAGGAGFYGMVYAPQASVLPAGGSQIYGSLVGKSIMCSGSGTYVHYDESLASIAGSGPLRQVSWREVRPRG